jgi:hypothetical protein
MSAADQYSVCPQAESLEDKTGLNAAAAHDANCAHIRFVLYPSRARQVSASVATPIAQEGDYFRLETHINAPSICAIICSVVKCRLVIAPLGQAAAQVPQPLHRASLITDAFLSSLKEIAL